MTSSCQPNQTAGQKGSLIQFLLLGLLLLAVLAGATWYQQSLAPQAGVIRHECDLQQGPCQIELSNGRLQLEAGPLPMRSLSPLKLALSLDGMNANRILADLQGADMYMGINQFELQRISETNSADTSSANTPWQGQTELAVCTTGSMRWQLTLAIETPEGTQQHLFEFEAR
ncbi:hypothetical protein GCM10009104_11810 [Marinobacterium maritimum]|uniref:Uncharacterized protein n=1 Tax=Marinobacterium maritimum TaxID=500162 RepID=A0ABN1I4F0_9GAMM